MPLEIRQLTPGEGALLRSLRLAALRDAPDHLGESLEAALSRSDQSWADATAAAHAAFLDGQPVAMAYAFLDSSDSSVARLGGMWVAPEARRSGIGLALVRAIHAWAIAHAARCVNLWVLPDSPAACLYQRAGFTATGSTKPFSATDARTLIALELVARA